MWLRNWSIGVVLVGWALLAPASAQQPIRWEYNLPSAKQLAGQTNRLVVVHFWADWCSPCKRMEQDVFCRPEVATALEADYVAVKLHKDHFPATAKEFGVTAIPADVIITPQGQVVERFQGYTDARQYVGRLNRVAANYRMQNGRMFAQIPGQPAMPGPGVATSGAQGYQPALGAQAFADHRTTDPLARSPQGATIPANPPYASRPPMDFGGSRPDTGAGPQFGMNGTDMAVGTVVPGPMGIGASGYGVAPAVQAEQTRYPYAQNPVPTQDPLLLRQGSPMPMTTPPPPAQGQFYAGQVGQPSITPSPSQAAPSWQLTQPNNPQMAGAPVAEPAVPRSIEVPAGNPPLALDGYCPVQLTEKERWVRGSPKWGVRHEGRTYLFAGPEEQSRFYAEPDRFAPVLGGDDVVLMLEQGQRVAGRREHGGWFQNRVYLFTNEASFQKFFSDPLRYASAVAQAKASVASRPEAGLPPAGTQPTTPWAAPNPAAVTPTPYYR